MASMIERVARALDPDIWAIDGPVPTRADVTDFHARRQRSVQLARAAIEAMREPTDSMLSAGLADLQENLGDMSVIVRDPLSAWRTMVHAALSEQEG